MKNGTVQSRVKINEREQYTVNLSKSRRTHSLVSFVVDHFVERNIRLILIVKVNFGVLCYHFPQVSSRQNLLCCSDLFSAVGNLVWSPGHCWAGGAGSGLLEESISLLLTPLKKKGEWSPSTMWILQSTVFCKSQQFQNMPNFIDSAPFVE